MIELPCCIENDGNAAVLGEWWAGQADSSTLGSDNVCLLTLGTGVGGGVIANGRLLRGRMAAEIGHMIVDTSSSAIPCPCGQNGCLERYTSAAAIAALARRKIFNIVETAHSFTNEPISLEGKFLLKIAEDPAFSTKTVFDAAPQNPVEWDYRTAFPGEQYSDVPEASWSVFRTIMGDVFEEVVAILSTVCLNVARVLDTDTFYIGGGVCEAGSFFMEALQK